MNRTESAVPAIHYGVLLCCTVLSVFSCLLQAMLFSAGAIVARSVVVQCIALVLGYVLCLFMAKLNYRLVVKVVPIMVGMGILLMLLLKVPGLAYMPEGSDDLAWIRVGYFSMQPSETLKLVFIYTFSLHLSKVRTRLDRFSTVCWLCLHGAIPTLLVINTGDLGSALVIFLIFAMMIFAAGLARRYLLLGTAAIVLSIPIGWQLLPDYLQDRFRFAWHPEWDAEGVGYQQYQGLCALQKGGFFGNWLSGESTIHVPESYNDFIFTYIGQKFGFVSCIVVLLLLCSLMIWVLSIAAQAGEPLGRSLCIGVFAMLFSQSLINLGMVLCLIPVVGITLPFVSAGGTSMTVCFFGIGIVMSVYRFHPTPQLSHTNPHIDHIQQKRGMYESNHR